MTRFRDLPRIPLPEPKRAETIGKGKDERPLVYNSDTNRRARRSHGRYAVATRIPGVGIKHDDQPWHQDTAHKS